MSLSSVASPTDLPGVAAPLPPLSPSLSSKFRGAVIADLDLSPALSVAPSTPLTSALAMSYDRDYTYLTVTSPSNKSLLGYLDMPLIKKRLQEGTLTGKENVGEAMIKFRTKGRVYTVLTPETSLDDLLKFFLEQGGFAVVTDDERKWVVGVATAEDLVRFVSRRPD